MTGICNRYELEQMIFTKEKFNPLIVNSLWPDNNEDGYNGTTRPYLKSVTFDADTLYDLLKITPTKVVAAHSEDFKPMEILVNWSTFTCKPYKTDGAFEKVSFRIKGDMPILNDSHIEALQDYTKFEVEFETEWSKNQKELDI